MPSTQTVYLWRGWTHDGECEPGVCPVKPRKGRKRPCGCISHDPVDHQAGCGHCGAGEDEWCKPGCPIGEADAKAVEEGLST
jgi:hypothetical protein